MKWRVGKVGKLKIALGEKRSIVTYKDGLSWKSIVGTYFAVYWDGTEKFVQILKLEK